MKDRWFYMRKAVSVCQVLMVFVLPGVVSFCITRCVCSPETVTEDPVPIPTHTIEIPQTTSSSSVTTSTATTSVVVWEVVKDLNSVLGNWRVRKEYKGEGSTLQLEKGAENSLYPYSLRHVSRTDDAFECGFYGKLGAGWRLAYCSGGKDAGSGAVPYRLELYLMEKQPDLLLLRIKGVVDLYLERSP